MIYLFVKPDIPQIIVNLQSISEPGRIMPGLALHNVMPCFSGIGHICFSAGCRCGAYNCLRLSARRLISIWNIVRNSEFFDVTAIMNEYEYSPRGGYNPDFGDEAQAATYERRYERDGKAPASRDYEGRSGGYRRESQQKEPVRESRRRQPASRPTDGRRQPLTSDEPRVAGPSGSPRKPRAEKRASRPIGEWGVVKFLKDKRFHAVIGVGLVFVAVYVAVAAISFIRSGAADQSLLAEESVRQIVEAGKPVENAAGPVGARLAQSVIVEGLGLGAAALVVYFILLGLSLIGARKARFWSLTFKTLLVSVTVSMVFGLISLWSGADFNLGGYHGQYINMILAANLDWIGASLVSLLLVVAVFYVYINDLMSIYNRWQSMRRAARERAEQMRMERDEARERVRRAMLDADEEAKAAEAAERPADDANAVAPADDRPAVSVGFDTDERPDDIYAIGNDSVAESEPSEESVSAAADSVPEEERPEEVCEEQVVSAESNVSVPDEHLAYVPDSAADAAEVSETAAPVETPTDEAAAPAIVSATTPATSENTDNHISVPGLDVVANTIEEASQADTSLYDPTAELSRFQLPPLEILRDIPIKQHSVDMEEQEANKQQITRTLATYGIGISHIKATVGPTITLYEIIPAEGVRIATIKRLEDDIAMSLSALSTRIIAPIPGKGTIGIEVPNQDPQVVSIRSILGSKKFQECKMQLPMAMGATISNEVYIADLTKMPHLLVAGATGMGKSVGLNTIIASLLYKKHPAELKFVLIDPKTVEFSLYNVLENHYLAKLPDEESAVVTEMQHVLLTLNSLVVEMENRYALLRDANVRSITEYNDKFIQKRLNPEKGHRYLPYIVVIIDEFFDLIITAGKEVEKPIVRIAQMARAVGMHMIIATQRPSTNVITGVIKANFPGRMAFRVASSVDSKTILDRTGAHQLIGKGDMLFACNGIMDRVQCAFIDTAEVEAICQHIDSQVGYPHAYLLPEPQIENEGNAPTLGSAAERDPLFMECAEFVVSSGVASTSQLQRRYNIGFNRAGRIMDQIEAAGIVGPAQGGKPRQVLIDPMQLAPILRSLG